MKSRIFCFIAIFVGTLAFYVLAIPVSTTVESTTSTTQENINCTNPNFKTYIYCLKRLKRHHHNNDDPNHGEYDEICKTSCMKKCEYERSTSDCQDYCSYCLRRTKHKQQVITETEYETESAKTTVCKNNTDCEVHPKDSKPFNITVIVDVNTSSANGSSSVSPPVVFPPFPPYPPYPPYAPFPPYPPYPPYPPHPWSPPRHHCNQQSCCCHESSQTHWQPGTPCPQPQPRPIGYDCSVCNYPQTYYLCTILCLQRPVHQPCVSPNCVGGKSEARPSIDHFVDQVHI